MVGYISTVKELLNTNNSDIIRCLTEKYPLAESSQIVSWETLLNDIKTSTAISNLPQDVIVSIEYSLPTDGMAIDLIIAGISSSGDRCAYIIESKQWNTQYITDATFCAYREPGKELHPQIQVSRHKLSFQDYLDIGTKYTVSPFVYIRNSSFTSAQSLIEQNPWPSTRTIPIATNIDDIISIAAENLVSGDDDIAYDLSNAQYCPSKEIIDAMSSIVTKEEPFILTEEQNRAVQEIKKSIADGKKVIRVVGAAGSGKTAILLNLYVQYLNEKEETQLRPIFISGAQNTAYYRSLFPEVQNSFSYSFSLEKMVAKTKGNLYVLLMDEAQHNQEGIITNMVNRGATLILCYDVSQIINADNSIAELKRLEERDDFTTIELKDSVRFNGSQIAEKNIKTCLRGGKEFEEDELYDFQLFSDFESFQNKVKETIVAHPDETVAVTGLLSFDSKKYTVEENPDSILFTKWGSKTECEWMPYIRDKIYFEKNDGNLWVGTWWMPGLDVDYVAVLVGGDVTMTPNGVIANPEQAKHYRMMVSIATQLNLPSELITEKKIFGKLSIDYFNSSKRIIEYINKPENAELKDKYISLFSKLLRNNYYIMMSRGRKGCFVYFANSEEN